MGLLYSSRRALTGGATLPAYYVDATGGNDANSGLYPGAAWQTIAKVNASTLLPGDRIRFKRGETWREQLTVPSSGVSGNLITFGAYGTGASPIINGSDIITGWALDAGNVYSVAHAVTEQTVVVEDGTRLELVVDRPSIVQGSYFLDAGADVLYVWCTDDADPDTHTMEVGTRNRTIEGIGRSYITVQDIHTRYSADVSINLNGSQNWIIKHCTLESCRSVHIYTTNNPCNSLAISENSFMSAGQECIYLKDNLHLSGTIRIENNTYTGENGWAIWEGDCIDIKSGNTATILIRGNILTQDAAWVPANDYSSGCIVCASPATIEHNVVTNPTDRGIACAAGADGSIVRYNMIYYSRAGASCLMDGIALDADDCQVYYNLLVADNMSSSDHHFAFYISLVGGQSGLKIYNNIAWGNWQQGFREGNGGAMTNCELKNNVLVGWKEWAIRIDDAFVSFVSDNNCLYSTEPGINYGYYNGSNYWSFANWQGAGFDPNSVNADPLLIAPPGDLTLQVGSPCRDAGVDVGLTQDYAGVSVPQEANPAIGAYEYVM